MVNKINQILQDHNQKETLGETKMDSLGEIMANNDPNGATAVSKQVKSGQTGDKISLMTGKDQNKRVLLKKYKI